MLLGLGILPLALLFTGCGQNQTDIVKAQMSEITYDYFYGKCDEFEISISSGEREEPYAYDGVSQEKCDFALVVVDLNTTIEKLNMTFSINGDASSVVLEYNYKTGTHMIDLEKRLDSDDIISVKYGNTQISIDCLSNEFAINYEKAIEIGVNEFSENITNLMQSGELKAEVYLKVLDNLSNNFDKSFWCFSIVDEKGQHLNCIIDTENGNIVART
jgi:hypothetical protein